MANLGAMSGLLQANGLGHALGMGLPSGLTGHRPHGLGSHDGGSSENLLSSESGEWGCGCLPACLQGRRCVCVCVWQGGKCMGSSTGSRHAPAVDRVAQFLHPCTPAHHMPLPPWLLWLCCAAEGPASLAPLPSSMPTNLGISEAHHMMGGGGGLHHGLPSSNSMNNLQAMQVRACVCLCGATMQQWLSLPLLACLPALPAVDAVLTLLPSPSPPPPPLRPPPRRPACRCLACRA